MGAVGTADLGFAERIRVRFQVLLSTVSTHDYHISEDGEKTIPKNWVGRDPTYHPLPILQSRELRLQVRKGLGQGCTVRCKHMPGPTGAS